MFCWYPCGGLWKAVFTLGPWFGEGWFGLESLVDGSILDGLRCKLLLN